MYPNVHFFQISECLEHADFELTRLTVITLYIYNYVKP